MNDPQPREAEEEFVYKNSNNPNYIIITHWYIL